MARAGRRDVDRQPHGAYIPGRCSGIFSRTVVYFGVGLTIGAPGHQAHQCGQLERFSQSSRPPATSSRFCWPTALWPERSTSTSCSPRSWRGSPSSTGSAGIFADSVEAISKVSFAFFIPVYFAIVGLKLDLIRGVSISMIVIFIAGTCAVKVVSVALAGRLAGLPWG